MDVDEVLAVSGRIALVEDVVVDEVLRALRAKLQHDAHRCVGVDVRIVALEVGVDGIRKEDVAVARHEMFLREAALRVALAVGDVATCDVVEAMHEQLLFDEILNLLDADLRALAKRRLDCRRHRVDLDARHRVDVFLARRRDRIADLRAVIGDGVSCTLRYGRHCHILSSLYYMLWFVFDGTEDIVTEERDVGKKIFRVC